MDKKIIKQVYISGSSKIESSTKSPLIIHNKEEQSTKSDKEHFNIIPKPENINSNRSQEVKNDTIKKQLDENLSKKSNKIFLTDENFSDSKPDKNSNKKKGIWERIKKIKNIEIYIAIAFVVIVLFIYFSSNFSWPSKNNKNNQNNYTSAYDYCLETEKKLSKLLSTIEDAGKVDIMITFESTPERVIAYITSTSKNTSSGGDGGFNENTQNSSSPQVIYVSGDQLPLILKEVSPKVIGVLIVAEGADDIRVKLDIINAVSVLLDVSPEQIKVLTMNKG